MHKAPFSKLFDPSGDLLLQVLTKVLGRFVAQRLLRDLGLDWRQMPDLSLADQQKRLADAGQRQDLEHRKRVSYVQQKRATKGRDPREITQSSYYLGINLKFFLVLVQPFFLIVFCFKSRTALQLIQATRLQVQDIAKEAHASCSSEFIAVREN